MIGITRFSATRIVGKQLSTYGQAVNTKFLNVADVDGVSRGIHYVDIGNDSSRPPIVILGGTAQTINTFGPHLRPMSKSRRIIVIELRCQGQTQLLPEYGTISQHVKDFNNIINALDISCVDLVGFSFGGRVGLAIASALPKLVNRISVTGVPLERAALGNMILQSWKEGLKEGNLRSCAWSFVLNGYSPHFIERHHNRLPMFVDMVVKGNDHNKLYHLMKHSHVQDNSDIYSIKSCASCVICPVQVIAATNDRISDLPSTRALADAIISSTFHEMDAGHLAPFESPVHWRNLVLDFLH